MTAPQQPQAPVPAPPAGAPAPAPVQDPNAAPPPQDQTQPPAESPPGGGESATDAAMNDPAAWQAAAELDARYAVVQRAMNGVVG